jgi:chaperonin cofactor prefoldin
MAYALTNNSLYLCRVKLKEVKEVKHHKETLAEDKIVYHEQGHAVRELGPSTSIPDLFTS